MIKMFVGWYLWRLSQPSWIRRCSYSMFLERSRGSKRSDSTTGFIVLVWGLHMCGTESEAAVGVYVLVLGVETRSVRLYFSFIDVVLSSGTSSRLWNGFHCCFLSASLCPGLHTNSLMIVLTFFMYVCVIMCVFICKIVSLCGCFVLSLSLGRDGHGVWSWSWCLWLHGIMYERTKRRELRDLLKLICLRTRSSLGAGGQRMIDVHFDSIAVGSHSVASAGGF